MKDFNAKRQRSKGAEDELFSLHRCVFASRLFQIRKYPQMAQILTENRGEICVYLWNLWINKSFELSKLLPQDRYNACAEKYNPLPCGC